MKHINKQVEDWDELRKLCTRAQNIDNKESKKQVLNQFYMGVKQYATTYKTKFDMFNKPK